MPRVALVCQRDGTDLFTDGPLLFSALEGVGVEAQAVPWGSATDWASFDAVVVRTTWDYVERFEEFFAWARSVEATGVPLANPVEVLAWNADKRYLRDLEMAGAPIVATRWLDPGDDPIAAVAAIPWDEFVVKPAVSAGSRMTARYAAGEHAAAVAHLRRIVATGGAAMVQPHIATVDEVGENGTYVFGGRVSHVISKGAVLKPGAAPVQDNSLAETQEAAPAAVTAELGAFASDVLARLPFADPVLYARVDTVRVDEGALALLELELFEPFLFLEISPGAAENYAAALVSWLERTPEASAR
ncbi:MAG TPA: hypothetical protein VM030_11665 [Acidimicrobiales bacterium]|nr:hypothetical protein [Acidimicrobiales bacterium]